MSNMEQYYMLKTYQIKHNFNHQHQLGYKLGHFVWEQYSDTLNLTNAGHEPAKQQQ